MQQFFMSPYFRSFIFSAVDQKKNELLIEDNVLYQSKYLFANLMNSKMPTYNPVVFFNSIKDFNGEPMPTNEQRDVDEFLNIYMDKIEQNIKGTDDHKYLNSIFGGSFAQELICKGCPHRSSREEQYLSVNIEIKNKSNILEGLDLFIQGEMLEGDNAYYCERCDKKIDTLKRCCIKKLPNCLVLSLKRFEFDLETLSRYKLNSYCEFYDELDMKNYCQETLAKNELLKKMKDENLTYEMLSDDDKAIHDYNMPDIYYKYKLKGTVVHYGTADGGHYYSFIKDRNTEKWYEFNDTSVRDYDSENLPEDAFGGKLKQEQKIISGGRQHIQTEKLHNAYILIYERQEYIDNEKLVELRETKPNENLKRYIESYKLPMRPIIIEKSISEDLISTYDKQWVSNKMFDQFFLNTMADMCICGCSYLQADSEKALKHAMDIDGDQEMAKLKFSFLFLFGVILRSEQRTHITQKLVPGIRSSIKNSPLFARWVLTCLSKKHSIYEFFVNCWSTEACRIICSIFKDALVKVYAEERSDVIKIVAKSRKIRSTSPEDLPNYFIKLMSDPDQAIPLSLKCLYQFITISVTHMEIDESINLAQFYFNYVINQY